MRTYLRYEIIDDRDNVIRSDTIETTNIINRNAAHPLRLRITHVIPNINREMTGLMEETRSRITELEPWIDGEM